MLNVPAPARRYRVLRSRQPCQRHFSKHHSIRFTSLSLFRGFSRRFVIKTHCRGTGELCYPRCTRVANNASESSSEFSPRFHDATSNINPPFFFLPLSAVLQIVNVTLLLLRSCRECMLLWACII